MNPKSTSSTTSSFSGSSWDDGFENLVIVVQGQYSAGKTTLAATLSKHMPDPLPTQKHKGPPKYNLKDIFWLCYDKGALLSFKERGISVPRFDIRACMAEKKCSVLTATEMGLREAEKASRDWIVVDTVSTYDKMLDVYWLGSLIGDKALKDEDAAKSLSKLSEEVQIKKFGLMFNSHKMLHDNLMRFGCGVMYLTHSKAEIDLGLGSADDREKQKKVKQMTSVASGGILKPDITGKGAGVYKADARLQLVIVATKGANGKLMRQVYADSWGGYETKNSWELSIQGPQEANMRKILAKVA